MNKDFRNALDQRLSGMRWGEREQANVLRQIRQKEVQEVKHVKRGSAMLAFAMATLLFVMGTAFAVTVLPTVTPIPMPKIEAHPLSPGEAVSAVTLENEFVTAAFSGGVYDQQNVEITLEMTLKTGTPYTELRHYSLIDYAFPDALYRAVQLYLTVEETEFPFARKTYQFQPGPIHQDGATMTQTFTVTSALLNETAQVETDMRFYDHEKNLVVQTNSSFFLRTEEGTMAAPTSAILPTAVPILNVSPLTPQAPETRPVATPRPSFSPIVPTVSSLPEADVMLHEQGASSWTVFQNDWLEVELAELTANDDGRLCMALCASLFDDVPYTEVILLPDDAVQADVTLKPGQLGVYLGCTANRLGTEQSLVPLKTSRSYPGPAAIQYLVSPFAVEENERVFLTLFVTCYAPDGTEIFSSSRSAAIVKDQLTDTSNQLMMSRALMETGGARTHVLSETDEFTIIASHGLDRDGEVEVRVNVLAERHDDMCLDTKLDIERYGVAGPDDPRVRGYVDVRIETVPNLQNIGEQSGDYSWQVRTDSIVVEQAAFFIHQPEHPEYVLDSRLVHIHVRITGEAGEELYNVKLPYYLGDPFYQATPTPNVLAQVTPTPQAASESTVRPAAQGMRLRIDIEEAACNGSQASIVLRFKPLESEKYHVASMNGSEWNEVAGLESMHLEASVYLLEEFRRTYDAAFQVPWEMIGYRFLPEDGGIEAVFQLDVAAYFDIVAQGHLPNRLDVNVWDDDGNLIDGVGLLIPVACDASLAPILQAMMPTPQPIRLPDEEPLLQSDHLNTYLMQSSYDGTHVSMTLQLIPTDPTSCQVASFNGRALRVQDGLTPLHTELIARLIAEYVDVEGETAEMVDLWHIAEERVLPDVHGLEVVLQAEVSEYSVMTNQPEIRYYLLVETNDANGMFLEGIGIQTSLQRDDLVEANER